MKNERKKQLEQLYVDCVQKKAEEISKWIYDHPEDGDQEFLSNAVRLFKDSISMRAKG